MVDMGRLLHLSLNVCIQDSYEAATAAPRQALCSLGYLFGLCLPLVKSSRSSKKKKNNLYWQSISRGAYLLDTIVSSRKVWSEMDLGQKMETSFPQFWTSFLVRWTSFLLPIRSSRIANLTTLVLSFQGRGVRHRGFAYESLGGIHARLVKSEYNIQAVDSNGGFTIPHARKKGCTSSYRNEIMMGCSDDGLTG